MISHDSWVTPTVLVFTFIALLSCTQNARAADVCATPVVIILAASSDGTCTQVGASNPTSNPIAAPAVVDIGSCIQYKAGAHSLEVQFEQGPSPFYDFTAASGQTVTTGPVGLKLPQGIPNFLTGRT